MATRPSWRGHLRISLVSFPIELYLASRSSRNIPLRQIHKPTGKPVNYLYTVDEVGPVERDEIVKGYEYSKGQYVELDPGEVANLRLSTTTTIDIVQFVDPSEIDLIY